MTHEDWWLDSVIDAFWDSYDTREACWALTKEAFEAGRFKRRAGGSLMPILGVSLCGVNVVLHWTSWPYLFAANAGTFKQLIEVRLWRFMLRADWSAWC